jgi:citrate lyase beta subunit|tara:strand:+ start:4408 stop:5382 length:975 start_codon:yes stop_codon:yes gene_type:complete
VNNINVIQYLPLTHPRATLRFVKKLSAAGVMSILDLEDSAQDPFDKDKTRDLKISARNNFLELVNSKVWTGDEFGCPIYVRVNSSSTEFFEDDIQAVRHIHSLGFPIAGIFLPMVESYDLIKKTDALLESDSSIKAQNSALEIIPMIETKAGMENLLSMLESDKYEQRFSKVHYGHFDYCLDKGLWPFPDPDHDSFWSLIEPMARLILEHKKTYIHTPFPFMDDVNLFWAASSHLISLFSEGEMWACTLNSEISLAKEPAEKPLLQIHTPKHSIEFKIQEAKKIQEHFLAGRANRRSFGVSSNRFIPPHQYFSAEQFLKNNQTD